MSNDNLQLVFLITSVVGVIMTGAGLWVSYISLRKQLRLNFFADYTKRYQEITLMFPENFNEENFSFEKLTPEIRDRTLRYLRAYFDLCSEEYFLHLRKHIDNKTWREWKSGNQFAFSKKAFKDGWARISLDSKYYTSFTKFINTEIMADNV